MCEFTYVLDKNGNPLMPSKRFGRIRHLLKDGLAKIVDYKPFTIQLLYESTTYTQPLYGGIDPGRTNIGISVANEKGETVYASVTETNNKEVTKHMKEKKINRQARRRGERQVKKRRAKQCDTVTDFPEGRKLPGYKDGVLGLKHIINSEAKFNNRKRKKGWITPTANHCVQTHIHLIDKISKILPIKQWTMEYNKFAFMLMDDGTIQGADFQNGRMKGFANVESFIRYLQNGRCAICGKPIEHYHHIIPQSEGGNDLPENIIGLCSECHQKLHTKKIEKKLEKIGEKKKYGALSILNISMPFIYNSLIEKYGKENIFICSGYDTSKIRGEEFKDHWIDAICIAVRHTNINPNLKTEFKPFKIVQFRKHDRAKINAQRERTYKLDNKKIATNRNPRCEQKGDSLQDWHKKMIQEFGEKIARQMVSKLKVNKSLRHYNNMDRQLPGAVFLYNGKRYVMTGNSNKGVYYRAYGMGKENFTVSDCKIVCSVKNLQYI